MLIDKIVRCSYSKTMKSNSIVHFFDIAYDFSENAVNISITTFHFVCGINVDTS